jgi:hypothetical protein
MTKILAIVFIFLALSVKAQMPPPPLPIVTNDTQSVDIYFTPSPSPNIASYSILVATNGVFFQTNSTTGTNVEIDGLPIAHLSFYGISVASNGLESALSSPLTFSGWAQGEQTALQKSADMANWSSVYAETNLTGNGFYRIAETKFVYPLP